MMIIGYFSKFIERITVTYGGITMKKLFSLFLSICTLLLTTSCNMIVKEDSDEQYDYPVTVGNAVFTESPKKVAVLSDNLADIILACGYEGKLVARSDSCTQESLSVLPTVGTPDEPSMSKLTELGVDLVLGDESLDDELNQEVESMGARVLIIKPAANDDELKKLYNNLASILGGNYTGKMKAMSTLDSIQSSLDSIKNSIVDTNVLSTVCYIYDVDGDQCEVSYGDDYTAELFDYAQVTNVAAEDDDGYIGIDTLLRSNPENIFCDVGVYEKLTGNKDLKSLTAVVNAKVYTLPQEYLTLQGKTRITTVDYIAAKTHDLYKSVVTWPEEFETVQPEYVAPFTPEEGIFYTIGETYAPIKFVEERLIGLGYMEGEADETFTEDTAYAVSYFQSLNGLDVTGIADYNTMTVLMSDKAVPVGGSADEGVTVEY